MASITTRAGKGSPLTNAEVDANFTNLNSELATKQATLVSGTSIKTVNGTSVLGSGNIQIGGTPGGSDTQVQYNNAGAFAGSSNLTFDGASLTVGVARIGGTNTSNNTFIGQQALQSNISAENTAVGYRALFSNTTGSYNTSNGSIALQLNTTGSRNTANGYEAIGNNTTGNDNTGVGYRSLASNGTGSCNTSIGSSALQSNGAGNNNTATGNGSLQSNGIGNGNTASGYNTLQANVVGSNNTAFGNSALYSNDGFINTAIGANALYNNSSGYSNTGLGFQALYNVTTGSGNTAISPVNGAGSYIPVFDPTTQSNRFCMGSTAVTNAYIQVAWTVVSDARDKTDFAPVPHGLDFVNQLKPTAYRYKETRESTEGHGPLRYGFKAQDVLELEGSNPVIVDAEDSEKLRFNDQSMIAVLVNAIQELSEKFESYKATHP